MMIAIPVMRGRVAPVLNWCSRIVIFPARPERGGDRELCTPELGPAARLQLLREQGVQTLICGALSLDLQNYAAVLGFKLIPGVAGDIEDVLEAYRQNRLHQPEFWLPGCRRPRHYRQGLENQEFLKNAQNQGGKAVMPRSVRGAGSGPGGGSGGGCRGLGRSSETGQGTTNFCLCQACGAKTPHERGIPCIQVLCPQCGKPMVRE